MVSLNRETLFDAEILLKISSFACTPYFPEKKSRCFYQERKESPAALLNTVILRIYGLIQYILETSLFIYGEFSLDRTDSDDERYPA